MALKKKRKRNRFLNKEVEWSGVEDINERERASGRDMQAGGGVESGDAAPPSHLRWPILPCSHSTHQPGLRVFVEVTCKPKINDDGAYPGAFGGHQQHVPRFDIAVDNVGGTKPNEGTCNASEHL